MAYTLHTLTKTGAFADAPFRCYTDALGVAMARVRNGTPCAQIIVNGQGELQVRLEPEPPRGTSRPVFAGTEKKSGSVVTPGLSAMGGTLDQFSTVSRGGGLSPMGGTADDIFDLAEGV